MVVSLFSFCPSMGGRLFYILILCDQNIGENKVEKKSLFDSWFERVQSPKLFEHPWWNHVPEELLTSWLNRKQKAGQEGAGNNRYQWTHIC